MKRKNLTEYMAVAALCVLRLSLAGFSYTPMLDDYIQYHNYRYLQGGLSELIDGLGLLAARPLAGIADIGFWSLFYENLFIAVVLISLIYAAAAFLFRRAFGAGIWFYAVFLLSPVTLEGTYWLSAATRVVPSLLAAALAVTCVKGRRPVPSAFLCLVFCLMAAGFYEQGFVLAATLVIVLGFVKKKYYYMLVPFASFGIYLTFTSIWGESALYGGRMEIFMPWEVWEPVTAQIFGVVKGGFVIAANGFFRGFGTGISLVGVAIGVVLMWFLCSILSRGEGVDTKMSSRFGRGALGVIIMAAPLAPFFVLGNPWVSLRAVATCMPGAALLVDSILPALRGSGDGTKEGAKPDKVKEPEVKKGTNLLLDRVPDGKGGFTIAKPPSVGEVKAKSSGKRAKNGKNAKDRRFDVKFDIIRVGVCLLSGVFLLGISSELADYKKVTQYDTALLEELAMATEGMGRDMSVGIHGLEPYVLQEQNYVWHEHIHGITESRWALTGALRATAGSMDVPTVTPLAEDIYPDYSDMSQYDAILYWDEGDMSLSE